MWTLLQICFKKCEVDVERKEVIFSLRLVVEKYRNPLTFSELVNSDYVLCGRGQTDGKWRILHQYQVVVSAGVSTTLNRGLRLGVGSSIYHYFNGLPVQDRLSYINKLTLRFPDPYSPLLWVKDPVKWPKLQWSDIFGLAGKSVWYLKMGYLKQSVHTVICK